jgi:hypothetical protein
MSMETSQSALKGMVTKLFDFLGKLFFPYLHSRVTLKETLLIKFLISDKLLFGQIYNFKRYNFNAENRQPLLDSW